MARRTLNISPVSSNLKTAFTISRGAKTQAETLQVEIREGKFRGRGECVPYKRYGETLDSVAAQIEALRADLEAGLSRANLQTRLPPGAARCAVDCALWDLDAKISGTPVWQLAGLPAPRPLETMVTLSLDAPEMMAEAARVAPSTLLKLKLGGPEDLKRVEAVHRARPDARLVIDGNEGLMPDEFALIVAKAASLGVVLIEQPFPVNEDSALMKRPGAIAVCADESAHTAADIQSLAARYDAVNIKLDKAGGLTAALEMLQEARRAGMGVMIGCMVAGSLSMAPAVLLATLADYADVDGPLWLVDDIAHGLTFAGGLVSPPAPELWG